MAILTIEQHAQTGRDSEVIWALWLMKELGERLSRGVCDTIIQNNGPITLSLLAHFKKHGLIVDRKLKDKLHSIVSGNPFSGAYWPLTLELTHLGMESKQWDTVSATSPLRVLHEAKESIIDWDALPKVFGFDGDGNDDDGDEPEYAIEDYSDDYSDENGSPEDEEEEQPDPDDIAF